MASYKETTMLLPLSDSRTFGEMDWQYLTIHNTANRASAKSEAMYVHSGKSEVTYHFAIDDRECVQIQRLNMSCWHAGDGRGVGNTKSIAIEICYSLDKGDSRYPVAEDNAAHKAAKLLLSKGYGLDRLRKHQDWSGKYCPHRMLDNNGWEPFKKKVLKYMEELKGSKKTRLSTPDFIEKIKEGAIKGWKTHGILPSLTIAQAILESDSGNSELAVRANAIFGIKASTDPSWARIYKKKTSEWINGEYVEVLAGFKSYKSWDESIRDRLLYLTTRCINGVYIYKNLIGEVDYKRACQKIYDDGYATDPKYPGKLIDIIEKYKLYEYDKKALKESGVDFMDKQVIIAYWSDGDLPNAEALFNAIGAGLLTKTKDARIYKDKGAFVVQVGGYDIKGADKKVFGDDRLATLKEVAKFADEIKGGR